VSRTYWTHTLTVNAEIQVESSEFDPPDSSLQELVREHLDENQVAWDVEVTNSVRDEYHAG
jgi:hypothetical protein